MSDDKSQEPESIQVVDKKPILDGKVTYLGIATLASVYLYKQGIVLDPEAIIALAGTAIAIYGKYRKSM